MSILEAVIGADGAALVVGDDGVGAVGCVLADDLIAHHRAAVAHTDLTWLWFPHVPVSEDLAVQGAAKARTVVLALRSDQEHRCAEQQRQPQIHKAEHV